MYLKIIYSKREAVVGEKKKWRKKVNDRDEDEDGESNIHYMYRQAMNYICKQN